MTLGAKLHGSQWQSQVQMQRISSCSTRTMKFWKCRIQDMGQSLQQSSLFQRDWDLILASAICRYATRRHLDISPFTRLQRSNAASHMRCSIAFSLDGERFIQKQNLATQSIEIRCVFSLWNNLEAKLLLIPHPPKQCDLRAVLKMSQWVDMSFLLDVSIAMPCCKLPDRFSPGVSCGAGWRFQPLSSLLISSWREPAQELRWMSKSPWHQKALIYSK